MHTDESAIPKLIGVPSVAEHLGLAKRTVYMLIASGELGHCRVGRRVLVPAGDLRRFVDEHRPQPDPKGR